ncbi:uncharacterized protein BO72DRAFT_132848 [Aspergillus fijiensis CBS 313.89]|uniref:Uncharacterized protein n=1 Tax=Aspergillus fijiensis CBS 313.89 TaxID=1448319 RepID=A0A8G1VYF5_9EURO|nr:uncharacterized protein BO72DRAFT_132848 [Aspergillus fijiensis CBS 313.89]RAK76368.1 hypothetical protein BO72DRAFT_132848 [Aspergillus fijiensis CBS 313.89]
MFLWVHLSLEYLRRIKAKEPDTFVAKLKAVPPDTKGLYSILLATISKDQDPEGQEQIRLILTLLVYGLHKELSEVPGFLSAVNYKPGKQWSNLTARDVLDSCPTIVELTSSSPQKFRLIHFSVKEFIQTLAEYSPETAHARMAAHCMSYLNDHQPSSLWIRTPSAPTSWWLDKSKNTFDAYASRSWLVHCAQAGKLRQEAPLARHLQGFWSAENEFREFPFDRRVKSFTLRYRKSLSQLIDGGYNALVVDSKPTLF